MTSLLELFEKHGTDKGDYHVTYERFLADRRKSISSVLEVGIGTLDPAAHSSMVGYGAEHYRPGGSLRAWAEYFPHAVVWGLDTQPDTQFSDHIRISTRLADSTNYAQVEAALPKLLTFDLIIDDGSHWPESQVATFDNLWHRLKPDGLYVIEDVSSLQAVIDNIDQAMFLGPHHNLLVIPKL